MLLRQMMRKASLSVLVYLGSIQYELARSCKSETPLMVLHIDG